MNKNLKKILVFVKNVARLDMVRMHPFIKVSKQFSGVKSDFLTHADDLIHGAMIRGDKSRDNMSLGEIRFLKNKLKANFKVLDVGANLGSVAITLAKSDDSITVVCFEPEPINYAMLIVNLKLNNVVNVQPFNNAVGTCEEYINMYINAGNYGDHRSYVPEGEDKENGCFSKQLVPILKVDVRKMLPLSMGDNCPKKFDLIKIDTQGADLDVLRSVYPFCSDGTIVAIEFSPWHLSSFGESWDAILEILEKFSIITMINPDNVDEIERDIDMESIKDYYYQNKDSYTGYMDLALYA